MKTLRRSAVTTVATLLLLTPHTAVAQAPAVRLLVSNGVKAVVEALQAQAERSIAHPLSIQFDTSASLKKRIDGGEAFDVVIVTTELMDTLIKDGKVNAGTHAAIARSGIGVGMRKGTVKPDVSTPAAIKRMLLAAHAIAYAQEGASRVYIVEMLNSLGIAEEMKSKTILERNSVESAARVTKGDADFVLTLVSEILPIPGIELAGPLPSEFQHYVDLSAGVSAKANDAAAAKALVQFLAGPSAGPTLKSKGMEKPSAN